MKVLHVIDKSYLGGGQSCVLNLLSGFRGSGVETALTCRGGGPLVEAARRLGVAVHPVPFDKRFRAGPARRIAEIAAEEGATLLHAHGLVATTYAVLARGLGLRVPVVYHQHGFHHHNYGRLTRGGRRLAEKLACRRVARVIAVSDADACTLSSQGYAPPERITRVHYGIPEPAVPEADAASAREALAALRGGGPVVGIVSRLHPQKGVDVFLRAAALVLAEVPSARFVVVGAGELERELHGLAAELGLEGSLLWAGGVPARPYLDLLDVATLTSRWEGLPLTLLEYMATGRAIVASDVPGNVEAVKDAAEVVPVGDARETASAMLRLLGSPDLAASRRVRARERFLQHFTVPHMARQVARLYQEVLS